MEEEIIIDKKRIFPLIDEHLYSKLLVDKQTMSYVTRPFETLQIKLIILKHFNNTKTIVDATAGIGCDTITFCKNFNHVISIEIDSTYFNFLKNNVNVYNFKNIELINDDCLMIIPTLKNIDVIFIDPPWGGKEYKKKSSIRLSISNINIENVILNFLNPTYMLSIPKLIIIKLPKNYDLLYFYECLKNEHVDIFSYELKKMLIIVLSTV